MKQKMLNITVIREDCTLVLNHKYAVEALFALATADVVKMEKRVIQRAAKKWHTLAKLTIAVMKSISYKDVQFSLGVAEAVLK